jgi:16S rRNA (cytosine1402-N4)-methyltransferase
MHSKLKHHPVMVDEIISYLAPEKLKTYVDCTFGQGGYSKKILEKTNCNIIAIDRDKDAIEHAKLLKKKYPKNFIFCVDNFSRLDQVLKKNDIKKIDGLIFDLGISNTQLNNPTRGFSFSNNGPLDMRMDIENLDLTAQKIINEFDQHNLSDIFYYYGEEKNSRQIARKIIEFRKKKEISTTFELVELIKKVNSYKKKHTATRVFQALRIFINDELNELDITLKKSLLFLKKNGKIITVAFHSLEDKVIKNFFSRNKEFLKILTKKPITPNETEIKINPRSRSARMRVAEIL